jgi:hypothetical protein
LRNCFASCKPFIVLLASRKLAFGIEASLARGDAGSDSGAARIPTSRKPAPWPPTEELTRTRFVGKKLVFGIEASPAHGDAGSDSGAARIPTSRKPASWPLTVGTETDEVRREAVKCPSWVNCGGAGSSALRQVKLNKRT